MKEIELLNGRGVVLVDDSDYDFLNRFEWRGLKRCSYGLSAYHGHYRINVYPNWPNLGTPDG